MNISQTRNRKVQFSAAVFLVLTASISVLFAGNLDHSLLWWVFFAVFLAALFVVAFVVAGHELKRTEIQQIACDLIALDVFQVALIAPQVDELLDRLSSLERERRESADKPHLPTETIQNLLGAFYEIDSRTPEEYLDSLERWIISYREAVDRKSGWMARILTGGGVALMLMNRSSTPITDIHLSLKLQTGVRVWSAREIDDEEPILPSPPSHYGLQNRFTRYFPDVSFLGSFSLNSTNDLDNSIRVSDDRCGLDFWLPKLRPLQEIDLPLFCVAVPTEMTKIVVDWTATAMNIHGIVRKTGVWSVETISWHDPSLD